jgi:hypothetical protein
MGKSLEILVAATLVAATPAKAQAEPCDTTPVSFLGNSFIVTLDHELKLKYSRNWGVERGNLMLQDTFPKTSGQQKCKKQHDTSGYGMKDNCDIFAFNGRRISHMRDNLQYFIQELHKLKSHRVVIVEGANSLSTGSRHDYIGPKKRKGYLRQVRKQLSVIVERLHAETISGQKVKVYISEMSTKLAGYSTMLNRQMIDSYNQLIRTVGADGIIDDSNLPRKPAELHGHVEETLPYFLAKVHEKVNPACGYAKISSQDYLRIAAEREAGRIRKNDYSRKVYAPYINKVKTESGRR